MTKAKLNEELSTEDMKKVIKYLSSERPKDSAFILGGVTMTRFNLLLQNWTKYKEQLFLDIGQQTAHTIIPEGREWMR